MPPRPEPYPNPNPNPNPNQEAGRAAEEQHLRRVEISAQLESAEREQKKAAKQQREEVRSQLRAELERAARKAAATEAAAARREYERVHQVTTASWHTPPPEEVSEAQVSAAVARLAEADACGGVVTTMSLAALTQAGRYRGDIGEI